MNQQTNYAILISRNNTVENGRPWKSGQTKDGALQMLGDGGV